MALTQESAVQLVSLEDAVRRDVVDASGFCRLGQYRMELVGNLMYQHEIGRVRDFPGNAGGR